MGWKIFFGIFLLGIGAFCFIWKQSPSIQSLTKASISGEMLTFEAQKSADDLMQMHRNELLKTSYHQFLPARLIYTPHLLLDVKYSKNASSTEEGLLLWGLIDAEMVLDTQGWVTSHGLEDCLNAKATLGEMGLIRQIALRGGALKSDQLLPPSSSNEEIDGLIKSCQKKSLLTLSGDLIRLHFDKPKFPALPFTRLNQEVVVTSGRNKTKMPVRYSTSHIKQFATQLFGNDFTIRQAKEVFVPFYELTVENPDGTLHTTYWNGITGDRFLLKAIR